MKTQQILVTAFIIIVVLGFGALAYVKTDFGRRAQPDSFSQIQEHYNTGNIDQAIADAQALVDANPSDTAALLTLATSYAQRGSLKFSEKENGDMAIAYAQQVLVLDPTNSEAYRIIGYAYEIMEQYDKAHENYDRAIELNPANSQALSNKGHAYDLQGEFELAKEWYARALSVNTTDPHALLNTARVQIRTGEFAQATATLEQMIALSPSTRMLAEAHQMLAIIAERQDIPDYERARQHLETALEYDETLTQALVQLGSLRMGDVSLVIQSQEEFDALMKEVDALALKALTYNPHQTSAYYLRYKVANMKKDTVLAQQMKVAALEALQDDITLGEREKREMRAVLSATVSVTFIEE